jgi:hypothetical protein
MRRRELVQATLAAGLILDSPRFLAVVTGRPAPGPRRRGLATGIGDLDGLLGGLRPGELVVLVGPAGAGKTCLAAQIAAHAAAGCGTPAVFFSLDDSVDDVRLRMACQLACVNFVRERIGPFTEEEERRMTSAREMLDKASLSIEPRYDPAPEEVERLARDRVRTGGARLLVVDHHPGLAGEDPACGGRGVAFGRLLRGLAAELGVPILAVTRAEPGEAGTTGGAAEGGSGRVLTLRRVDDPGLDGAFEGREVALHEAGRVEPAGRVRLCFWTRAGRFWSRGVGEAMRAALCHEERKVCIG